jgi:tetratricopeptide (TPR) repeat protein
VAVTLNNLALVYGHMQRLEEAETAFDEALGLYQKLAQSNPDAYQPLVATMLTNLGIVYSSTQGLEEAETACGEALRLFQKFAQKNPAIYQSNVAALEGVLAELAQLKKARKG